jgi:hypothetical protein
MLSLERTEWVAMFACMHARTRASRPCCCSKAWELAKEPCLALFLIIRLSWLSSSVPSFFSLLVAWELTPVCEINDADIAVFVTSSMFDIYRYALTAFNFGVSLFLRYQAYL